MTLEYPLISPPLVEKFFYWRWWFFNNFTKSSHPTWCSRERALERRSFASASRRRQLPTREEPSPLKQLGLCLYPAFQGSMRSFRPLRKCHVDFIPFYLNLSSSVSSVYLVKQRCLLPTRSVFRFMIGSRVSGEARNRQLYHLRPSDYPLKLRFCRLSLKFNLRHSVQLFEQIIRHREACRERIQKFRRIRNEQMLIGNYAWKIESGESHVDDSEKKTLWRSAKYV